MHINVLIVDDEILQLQLIGKIIQRYRPQYQIELEEDPLQALEKIKTGRFNALITDIKMPGMDGVELIRQVRKENISPLEVVFLSGYADFQYAQSAISYDVLEYLLKPVSSGSLKAMLDKLDRKLEKDHLEIGLKESVSFVNEQLCTLALHKVILGMETSQEEQRAISSFGSQIRLILTEAKPELQIQMDQRFPKPLKYRLNEERILLFLPIPKALFSTIPDIRCDGRLVIGRISEIAHLEKRYHEIMEMMYAADRMSWMNMIQTVENGEILAELKDLILQQNIIALDTLPARLTQSLKKGEIFLDQMETTVVQSIGKLLDRNELPVYANRNDDLLGVIRKRLSECRSAEDICNCIASVLSGTENKNAEDNSFMQSVIVYIEAHYRDKCSLQDISSSFHYSASHFSRLFTSIFHQSYTKYLAEFRMKKAMGMLLQTDLAVKEIAENVGIGDCGYFIRRFTQQYQLPPDKYRRIKGERSRANTK